MEGNPKRSAEVGALWQFETEGWWHARLAETERTDGPAAAQYFDLLPENEQGRRGYNMLYDGAVAVRRVKIREIGPACYCDARRK